MKLLDLIKKQKGFTNISALIGITLFLIPAVQLAMHHSPPVKTVSKIASTDTASINTLKSAVMTKNLSTIKTTFNSMTISQIKTSVLALSLDEKKTLAASELTLLPAELNSNTTLKNNLIASMADIINHPDLAFMADVWSYTPITLTKGDSNGGGADYTDHVNVYYIDDNGPSDDYFKRTLVHETFHAFDRHEAGLSASVPVSEGFAIWVVLNTYPVAELNASGLAGTIYGTENYYRDVGIDGFNRNQPIATYTTTSSKFQDELTYLASKDPSHLPWNDNDLLNKCYNLYFKSIDRKALDHDMLFAKAFEDATNDMEKNPTCETSGLTAPGTDGDGWCGNSAQTDGKTAKADGSAPSCSLSGASWDKKLNDNAYCVSKWGDVYTKFFSCSGTGGGNGANPGGGSTSPSGSPSPTQNAYPGPGYCGKNSPMNADVDPKWLADLSNPSAGITCNFGDTTGYKNDSNADAYCRQHIDTVHGFFYPCPTANSGNNGGGGGSNGGSGNGGLNPIIICKDHNGVDGSKYPNGYVAPLCMNATITPDPSNYTQGIYTTANATANKYKDGKYYDMYKCQGDAYDFIPFNDNYCSKPPWTPDSSAGAPSCPKSGDDSDKTIWDGTVCDYPPDACAQTGPGGHTNLCVPFSQKVSYSAPDTNYPNAADKKCTEYENKLGHSGSFACVLAPSGSPAPSPSSSPAAGGSSPAAPSPSSGAPSPSSGPSPSTASPSPSVSPGTETEYGHCYHGDQDCAPQYKCNSNPGTATSYCVYRNPSDPTAYCATAKNLHCVQANADGSIPADCDQTNLHMGDNYSCQRAKIGTFCCIGAPSTTSTSTGKTGSSNSSVASEGIPVSLKSCTNNSQCVQLKSGNACVFTNSQLAGVCMQY